MRTWRGAQGRQLKVSHATCYFLTVSLSFPLSPPPTFLPMAAPSGSPWVCTECGHVCKSRGGLTRHSSVHKQTTRVGEPHENFHRIYHPMFDGMYDSPLTMNVSDPIQGKPCCRDGVFLPPGTPPTPPPSKPDGNWTPFTSCAGFELAEILYTTASLSNSIIDNLLSIWSATLVPYNDSTPLLNHHNLHSTINAIKLGNVPWQSYTVWYNGLQPEDGPTPEWMTVEHQLWYQDPCKVIHNIFANPDLIDGIDYVPYHEFVNGKRRYSDFMSGDWAWNQCVCTFSQDA